jgi:uncharacterized membrane protein
MAGNIAHMLHVVSAVIWVTALVATIVGIGMLAKPQPDDDALFAYRQLSRKVVMWIHVAMLLSWITGIWMMFFIYDGFSDTGGHVHIMLLTALIMTVVLIASMAGPSKKYSRAQSGADAREALTGVRKYAMTGLVIGMLTIVVAALGAAW